MGKNRFMLTLLTLVTAVMILLTMWLGQQTASLPDNELLPMLLPEPRPLEGFRLTDQHGQPFGPERFKGQWSLLFFGYTHCPDICPTTLGNLKLLYKKLSKGEQAATQVVFVSVDPQRDGRDHLKQYLAYFNGDFLGLTGEREQIDRLARRAGAIYIFEGDTTGDEYIVNHSAQILLVDPRGRLYAQFLPPHQPSKLLADLRRLRDHYAD